MFVCKQTRVCLQTNTDFRFTLYIRTDVWYKLFGVSIYFDFHLTWNNVPYIIHKNKVTGHSFTSQLFSSSLIFFSLLFPYPLLFSYLLFSSLRFSYLFLFSYLLWFSFDKQQTLHTRKKWLNTVCHSLISFTSLLISYLFFSSLLLTSLLFFLSPLLSTSLLIAWFLFDKQQNKVTEHYFPLIQ